VFARGFRWAEGPARKGAGNYLVWNDIPNNRQMRWIEEDGHVDVFRKPSNFSNGNTLLPEICANLCFGGTRRNVNDLALIGRVLERTQ
jgi:gluconolactonase